ncbi:DNA repair protein RecO [Candidatus Uhrbacteria bacterium]|nr:DNA repair protein RecO [Candidatus Uhrbacteria bacterium]
MTFRTLGIIIGKKDFREHDKLFTLYTLERGKIQAMAQGCRKLSSKLAGNLELLNIATFTIAQGKAIDRIATVDIHHTNSDLKQNLEKLTCALHCIEVFDQCVKWDQADKELFSHVCAFLQSLTLAKDTMRAKISERFLAQLGVLLGYGTDYTHALEHPLRSKEYYDFVAGRKNLQKS